MAERQNDELRVQAHAAEVQMRAMLALTDTALAHLDLDTLLPVLLDRVREALVVDNATVLLLDGDEDERHLLMRAARGPGAVLAPDVRIPVGAGFAGRIVATRRPLIVADLSRYSVVNRRLPEQARSAVGAPLIVYEEHGQERVVGVLHVTTAEHHQFTQQDVQLLQRAAEWVAVAIERAQRYEAERRARARAEADRIAAEAARAEAERRAEELERVFDAMADGVAVYDQDGEMLRTNTALQRLLGLDMAPQDSTQRPLHEHRALIGVRDTQGRPLAPEEALIPRALAGQTVAGAEALDVRVRTFDGREVELRMSAAPLRAPTGQIVGAVSVLRDVTEHNRLERATQELAAQLQTTFDAMADLALLYDHTGRLLRINWAMQELLGITDLADFTARTLAERGQPFVIRAPDGELLPPAEYPIARALRGELPTAAHPQELLITDAHGRERALSFTGGLARDASGTLLGYVIVGHDITERRQMERDTRELAAQLQATLDAMSDAVLLYDSAGHVLRLNAAAQTLVGAEPGSTSVTGAAWWERIQQYHPRRLDGSPLPFEEWPMARVLRGETLTVVDAQDVALTDAQGREQVLSYAGGPARDADGQLMGYVFVVRDVTVSKRLERANAEQSEQLTRIFEGITDGVVVYDAAGHVTRTNGAARHLLGLDAAPATYGQLDAPDRAVLYEARDAQGQPLAAEEWPLIRVLQGQTGPNGESRDVRLRMLDGREVDVDTSAAPLRDAAGHLLGAVTVLHDQTERRRLEEARANELALRQVNERLDTFATIAAHDLRSPLGATWMAVERAQRLLGRAADAGAASGGEPQARAVAQATWAMALAGQSLHRVLRLVEQLLDVSRVKEGTLALNRQPVDLVELVRTCVAEQQLLNQGRTIAMRLPTLAGDDGAPLKVDADPDRLSQVLTNFLANAVRYAPEDQPIEVSVQAQVVSAPTAGSGGGLVARVAVRDHGPGIAPEEQASIWDRFQRARSISEAKGGLGLGLYIARTLIELHGGQVGVESTLGEGATFWFTLPLSRSAV